MLKPLSIRWLQRLLIALIFVEALALGSSLLQWDLLHSEVITQEAAQANDAREKIIGFAFAGLYLVTGIVFLRWILVAHRTVRSLGAYDLSVSPGWAVGSFFIPILNWFRPYVAMKELWQASLNPQSPKHQPVPSLLPAWWTLWIVNMIFGQVIFRLSMKAKELDEFQFITGVEIASSILGVLLSLVALTLVKRITANITALSVPPPLTV